MNKGIAVDVFGLHLEELDASGSFFIVHIYIYS